MPITKNIGAKPRCGDLPLGEPVRAWANTPEVTAQQCEICGVWRVQDGHLWGWEGGATALDAVLAFRARREAQ